MKQLVLSLFLSLGFTAIGGASESVVDNKKAEAFQVREYQTQTLKNGLTIIWIPDSSLPYVSLQTMIKAGSSRDLTGKEGLADFTASMLRKGSGKRTASRIADDLEQIGAEFSAGADADHTMISASALSFYKNEFLQQYAEILLNPSFTNAEIERLRQQVTGGLKKLADRPESFSAHLMNAFLFKGHPYGHSANGSIKSVAGMKRVDLQKYYSTHYVPENAVLAVVGQIDASWKKKVIDTFSAWKKRPVDAKELPEFPSWKGRELLLVDRADLNQAQVHIGFKGVPRNIPEYMELRAALKILGESFGSRLFEEIRVKRGLTYHIRAWFEPRLQAGPMGIYTSTRIDKVGEIVEESLKTYKAFVEKGITEAEMVTMKAYMRGQFPRTFETPEALATQLLLLNRYGISGDYLKTYLTVLDGLTRESVNATIKKYFDTENLRILVYAPKDKAEAPLKKIGKVEIKNYKDFLQ